MPAAPRYDEPFHWWGPTWDAPAARGIETLLRDGTIDIGQAAVLWAAVAQRGSIAVVGGPSRVGKSTLLSALLEFLPLNTSRVYLRGCYETFAFLTDPEVIPSETALLVNEISPHLPIYLWGPAVRRVLETASSGFSILATAHAATAPELVGSLTGSPLRIPIALVTALEFVVVLEPTAETRCGGRVRGIWRMRQTCAGAEIVNVPPIVSNDISHVDQLQQYPNNSLRFSNDDLIRRSLLLARLRDRKIERLPTVGSSPGEGSGLDES